MPFAPQDIAVRLELELHREFTGAFSLRDLIEFLKRQLIVLECTFVTRDEIITSRPSNERPQSQIPIVKYRRNERNPQPTAAECGFAENLTLEDKLGKLRKKGGHLRKFCKVRASCTSCGELRHLRIMCHRKNQNEEIATPVRGIMQDETLTNLTTTPVVLLPTMPVTIR
ncbi:hypothetical protein LAZ67_1007214 [Cordylochernes scorpioides]|uniref:Uncharacterized protein n=1 Tax=Cordylochernes scorpioides TaxID=51811 RepID=A0ABY6K2S6_9ARAC|nr:hypothetical protein LAZ67_1007214 [Cordylochernes scorpioides]